MSHLSAADQPATAGPSSPLHAIHSVLKEVADDGFRVRVKGTCMSPWLVDGSLVRVAAPRRLLPGDVLAYRDGNGRMVVHRLIGCYRRQGRWRLLLQADSARSPDPGIAGEQVLGKAIDVRVPLGYRLWAVLRFARFVIAFVWTKLRPTDRRKALK